MKRPRTGGPLIGSALALLALSILRDRCVDRMPVTPPCGTPSRPPAWTIDLNHADAASLQVLPGIGPGLADRIVRDRAVHGPFAGPSDLDRVAGVGPVLLERIRPFVR